MASGEETTSASAIPERELRSKTKAAVSFQTQSSPSRTNRRSFRGRAKSSTASPILSRKLIKSISRRNSTQITVDSIEINESMALDQNNTNDQISVLDDTMDCDIIERTTTSNNLPDGIVPNLTIDDNPTTDDNQTAAMENDHLNQSSDTDEENSVKRTMKTTKTTKKDVFKHFEKLVDGSYKCTLCVNSDKVFSKNNENSDSNLRSHLGKTHRMQDFLYPSQKAQHQPKPKMISSGEKAILDAAAIEAITQDSLPYNHFRKKGMTKFLSLMKPGYRGPHRKTVSKRLSLLYQEKRKLIKEQLSSVHNVSLTADVWKSKTHDYFICLTCHYFTASLENKSIVLSFRRFSDKHSGENFRNFIIHELKKMNLENKIQSITTDGGPDIKCATQGETFGIRIGCAAHNLNLVVKKALWLFDKTSTKAKSSSDATTKPNDDHNDYEECDDNEDDEEYEDYVAEIEVLNLDATGDGYCSDVSDDFTSNHDAANTSVVSNDDLSSNDDMNGTDDENEASPRVIESIQRPRNEQTATTATYHSDELPTTIFNLLKRIRKLVNFIRKSSVLSRYVRHQIHLKQTELTRRAEEQKTAAIKLNNFVLDFRIRWNTTYTMLSRFIALSGIVNDITLSPSTEIGLTKRQYEKLRKLSFSSNDWLCLSALKNVLFPFYKATSLLSGSKYPTLSISFQVLKGLKIFLTKNKNDQPLENAMKHLLFGQFHHYFERETKWEQKQATLIAAFLDPTTYRLLEDEERFEAERLLLVEFDINQSLEGLRINIPATTANSESTSSHHEPMLSSTTSKQTSSLNEFLSICEMTLPECTPTPFVKETFTFKEELCHYMATNRSQSDFAKYWLQEEKNLPKLLQFVKRYNCIPATSVPAESAFSVAGYIQRKTRSSLSTTGLRYSMILRE
ncbi:unnamed protein product [Adineta ricciae]|uniref:HAT C-terminal dimerisation domain-containing protein n=1 Tax=Adineta ricciae TaxID=249248 RepID=A0A815PWY1_ADIRI|nr:unnamed protein product [Adineta ricciae]CAF1454188.1 unnamed protein product [Adineta ricciae]